MAQKKYHYYVLVCTNYGAVFVTNVLPKNTAEWDKEKAPMEFTKSYAEDIYIGLSANGFLAYLVTSKWEITNQPYLYKRGEFKWVEKEHS